MSCPNDHELTEFMPGRYGFSCDGCKDKAAPYDTLYGCRTCNYDLCETCHSKKRRMEQNRQEMAIRTLLGMPIIGQPNDDNDSDNQSSMKCTKGHILCYTSPSGLLRTSPGYANAYICNKCTERFPKRGAYHCRTCHYDLCVSCYSKNQINKDNDGDTLSVKCRNGHGLDLQLMIGYGCDICGKIKRQTESYRCNICDYDVCGACYAKKENEETKDAESEDDEEEEEEEETDDVFKQMIVAMVRHEFEEKIKKLEIEYQQKLQIQLDSKNEELDKYQLLIKEKEAKILKLYENYKELESKQNKLKNALDLKNKSIEEYQDKFEKFDVLQSENQRKFEMIIKEKDTKISKLNDDYKELEYNHKTLKQRYDAQKSRIGHQAWDYQDIVEWIVKIEKGRFHKYRDILLQCMKEEEIDGSCLEDLNENDLYRMGVKSFKDKKALIKHIQMLVNNNSKKMENDDNNTKEYEEEGHVTDLYK